MDCVPDRPRAKAPSVPAVTIVLFHSVYGLRPAVHAAADRLRAAGTPGARPRPVRRPHRGDRRGGQGGQGRDRQGRAAEAGRSRRRAVLRARSRLRRVLARRFHRAEPGARRREGPRPAAAPRHLGHGGGHGRGRLPVQLHVADPDPFESDDWLNAWYLQMQRAGADVEIYRYRGAGHLYTDPELPDYDEAAAERTWRSRWTSSGSLAPGPAGRTGRNGPRGPEVRTPVPAVGGRRALVERGRDRGRPRSRTEPFTVIVLAVHEDGRGAVTLLLLVELLRHVQRPLVVGAVLDRLSKAALPLSAGTVCAIVIRYRGP